MFSPIKTRKALASTSRQSPHTTTSSSFKKRLTDARTYAHGSTSIGRCTAQTLPRPQTGAEVRRPEQLYYRSPLQEASKLNIVDYKETFFFINLWEEHQNLFEEWVNDNTNLYITLINDIAKVFHASENLKLEFLCSAAKAFIDTPPDTSYLKLLLIKHAYLKELPTSKTSRIKEARICFEKFVMTQPLKTSPYKELPTLKNKARPSFDMLLMQTIRNQVKPKQNDIALTADQLKNFNEARPPLGQSEQETLTLEQINRITLWSRTAHQLGYDTEPNSGNSNYEFELSIQP